MKRVLEVFGEPISRGGQESYVLSAIQNMDLSHLHIDLFTPYYCDNDDFIKYMNRIGGDVKACGIPFRVGGTRREIMPCFKKYLADNKYDIIHIHSGSISVLAYYSRIASLSGAKKVIVHSHSSGSKKTLKHFIIKSYAAHIFKKYVTDFCACSREAAQWKFPKSVLSEVIILKNGIDLHKFKYDPISRKKMREKYCIKDNVLVLGHVGRFTYEKNQIFLIDVLKQYLATNKHVKLVLVGAGIEIEKVKKRAEKLGVEKYVIFPGSKSNVNDYLNMFDVFLFPSYFEGLGIVALEAQASGLPVIASEGIPKAVKVTTNVSFCKLNFPNEWCQKITKNKNIERVDTHDELKLCGFDIKDSVKNLEALYAD